MRDLLKRLAEFLDNENGDSAFNTRASDFVQEIDAALEQPIFDPVSDVREFLRKFGWHYDGKPRVLPEELLSFRHGMMVEETEEYRCAAVSSLNALHVPRLLPLEDRDAYVTERLAEQLDALVDEVYICVGNTLLQGFNLPEAWRRVHAANMKKKRVRCAEESLRGSEFDAIKPPGWQKPDHTDLVQDHSHLVAADDDSPQ